MFLVLLVLWFTGCSPDPGSPTGRVPSGESIPIHARGCPLINPAESKVIIRHEEIPGT